MSVKSKVLQKLEENRGQFWSGSALADALQVSRNAVWKAIQGLQKEGYRIEAVTNKGYCLSEDNAILSKESIEQFLMDPAGKLRVEVKSEVSSTNTVLKQLAENGEAEGKVLAADRQTMGKGRSGRSFYSPSESGIYFSILLRPTFSATESLFITTAAAVAAAEGIERVTGKKVGIKWVNDLIFGQKKICGILTEASIDFETGGLAYAVLGIGINVNDPEGGYPEEIRAVAGSLYGAECCEGVVRSRLVAEILNSFMGYYKTLTDRSFMKQYRARSVVIGEMAEAYSGTESRIVKILDIDDDAALIVETENEEQMKLTSGEIRIRPADGGTFGQEFDME